MKFQRKHHPPGIGRTLLSALALVAFAVFGTSQAFASTAAGTSIENTVTVYYTDSAGTTDLSTSDTITVTVSTQIVAPTIIFDPSPGTTTGVGDTQDYTVTIITGSNGSGTISLDSAADSDPNNDFDSGVDLGEAPKFGTWTVGTTTWTLNATTIHPDDTLVSAGNQVTAQASGGNTIKLEVPIINGFTGSGSERVYLYDTTNTQHIGPFTVYTVDSTDGGDGYSVTITNNTSSDISFTPEAGWLIQQATNDTLTVTQGTIADPTVAASWLTTVEASMDSGGGTDPVGSTAVTTNATTSSISITKYVRNSTADTDGNPTSPTSTLNYAGSIYYPNTEAVNAEPGDTLEYVVVIENTGTESATEVYMSDTASLFTTLDTNSFSVDTNYDGSSNLVGTDDADAGNGILFASGNYIEVYLGTGASDTGANITNSGSGTGGTLAATDKVAIKYIVTIQ